MILAPDGPSLCMMCGAEEHDEPLPARFGMTCPGLNGNDDEKTLYIQERLFRTEVAAAYGEIIASSHEFMEHLARRNREATERVLNPQRSGVTLAELEAHADKISPATWAKIAHAAETLAPEEFEAQIAMIRVPTKDLSRRGSRLEVPKVSPTELNNSDNVDDAALFLKDEDNN